MSLTAMQNFVKGLTARDKYSLRNRDNLTQHNQVQLSQKQESLSQFLCLHF